MSRFVNFQAERESRRHVKPVEEMTLSLTTNVAEMEYNLEEIRHIIATKEDIHKVWPGNDMERSKILILDPGCASNTFILILRRARRLFFQARETPLKEEKISDLVKKQQKLLPFNSPIELFKMLEMSLLSKPKSCHACLNKRKSSPRIKSEWE